MRNKYQTRLDDIIAQERDKAQQKQNANRAAHRRRVGVVVVPRGDGAGGGKAIHPGVLAASYDELLVAGWGNYERSRIPADWRTRRPRVKFNANED